MNDCTFPSYQKGAACLSCGYKLKRDYPDGMHRNCGAKPQPDPPPLLGDRLAAFFAEHGLTPESYQRWKADHGIDAILGAGCGCDRRKELLNKADAAVRGGAAKLRAFMGW